MPFRKLVDSTSFPPEALAVLIEAFELAWTEISAQCGNDAARIENVRTLLAHAILAGAETEREDAVRLKDAALIAFSRMAPPG